MSGAHRGRAADAGLVALGGACGTLARLVLDGTLDGPLRDALDGGIAGVPDLPFGILVVNVLGAFLLGLLVEGLAPAGTDRWRATRLLLGTGVLGGFTTYSALAAGSAELLLSGGAGAVAAGAYALATLLLGGLASWAGIGSAAALRRCSRKTAEPSRPARGGAP